MITPPRKLGWQARGITCSDNDDDDDFSLWFVTVESVIIADREATSLRTPTYFSAARYDSVYSGLSSRPYTDAVWDLGIF